ncbi:transposase [uncultured Ilyobacter sp.]|uniref:transposase n=1 Tax=uncultured Ilyobacter sp. TaxID=544433 RepID=UPI003748B5ED
MACVDGLTCFSSAIASAFPKTEIQHCIIHQIINTTRYVSFKDIKSLMSDLKRVYQVNTEETALFSWIVLKRNGRRNTLK